MKIYRVIGLMSGTSLDGVDIALMRTDGRGYIEREGFMGIPYDPSLRDTVRAVFGKTRNEAVEAERALTIAHAEAVHRFLDAQGVQPRDIDLIGFHGQTIDHAPDRGYTCQIGDGALLAETTGIPVINDFRTRDVAAGGQGAPLVPVYHQALATGLEKPVVFLNIGGVSNVTYIGADGSLLAFDTGPGNALIDDWMLRHSGKAMDENGATAQQGKIDEAVLAQLLAHPFFDVAPPKSLDRNAFVSGAWAHLSPEDGAATLAAFTARTIAAATRHFPEQPQQWIVAGGGRHNRYLMSLLQNYLNVDITQIDTQGLNGDAIEAEAFAYLAVRALHGLPISFPGTTGVAQPLTGGQLHMVQGRTLDEKSA